MSLPDRSSLQGCQLENAQPFLHGMTGRDCWTSLAGILPSPSAAPALTLGTSGPNSTLVPALLKVKCPSDVKCPGLNSCERAASGDPESGEGEARLSLKVCISLS